MTSALSWLGLGIVLALALPGCSVIKDDASVDGAPQACCRAADSQLKEFEGCRILHRGSCKARRGEKFWMRGHVMCGPVNEAECAGGRCCTYKPQYDPGINEPVENWAPPGFDKPTNNVTDPNAKPVHDLPAPGEAPKGEADQTPSGEADQTPSGEAPGKAEPPASEPVP
jgi:hypothetical protein